MTELYCSAQHSGDLTIDVMIYVHHCPLAAFDGPHFSSTPSPASSSTSYSPGALLWDFRYRLLHATPPPRRPHLVLIASPLHRAFLICFLHIRTHPNGPKDTPAWSCTIIPRPASPNCDPITPIHLIQPDPYCTSNALISSRSQLALGHHRTLSLLSYFAFLITLLPVFHCAISL
jgi:hypothetical protein